MKQSEHIKILFCGDVVGRSGRNVVQRYLPEVVKRCKINCSIVNGENAAAGFGITPSICKEFYGYGVNVITTGNHIWDQKEIIPYIDQDANLLRPMNYPKKTPGKGFAIYKDLLGFKVLVINIMARLFMDPLDDPFTVLSGFLEQYKLKSNVDAIFIDVHGETTSEKLAIAHHLDGKVSCVVGTHTHVPTSDHRILNRGTAYMTDAGMCGDYDSIIGMEKEIVLSRFLTKIPTRLKAADGEGTFSGVIVSVSRETGLTEKIEPIILGKSLSEIHPEGWKND